MSTREDAALAALNTAIALARKPLFAMTAGERMFFGLSFDLNGTRVLRGDACCNAQKITAAMRKPRVGPRTSWRDMSPSTKRDAIHETVREWRHALSPEPVKGRLTVPASCRTCFFPRQSANCSGSGDTDENHRSGL